MTVRAPFNADQNLALLAGLKLPTGRTNLANAARQRAERSLQPGTSSTDLLLSLSHHALLHGPHGWFTQAMWQHALKDHTE